jgi:hypothetical protein
MLLSTEKCLDCWFPAMKFALGFKRAKQAQRAMKVVIDKAKEAELEGRIKDMQPLFATCNPTSSIHEGFYRLEIRYHPVVDGQKLQARSWITTVLEPEEDDDRLSTQAGEAVEG